MIIAHKRNEYFFRNEEGRDIIFNGEDQIRINSLINRYVAASGIGSSEYVFAPIVHTNGESRMTQLKINRNNTITYFDIIGIMGSIEKIKLKTIQLRAKKIYNLPLIGNIDRSAINENSIIIMNDRRLTPFEMREILDIGIRSIQCSPPEIDRLQCVICYANEKNKVYLECGHMVLCDSCAIIHTLTKNIRDAAGNLLCQCPLCRVTSHRFVNSLYG